MEDVVYLVRAYRLGFTNQPHYIVGCTSIFEFADSLASKEREDRVGKYGIEIVKFINGVENDIVKYYPSSHGEEKPQIDKRQESWDIFTSNIQTGCYLGREGANTPKELIDNWNKFFHYHVEYSEIICDMCRAKKPQDEIDRKSKEIAEKHYEK